MFDSHVHTTFSSDSQMTIDEVLKKSKELNVGAILTEHMDLNYPESNKFRFDCEEYLRQYNNIRSNTLLLGIEIGMHKDFCKEYEFISSKHKFDYVLGSIHFIDDHDIYYPETYNGKSKREIYEVYFKEMAENLLLHEYIDCLGHIDYICRYAVYEDTSISYDDFKIYIDEVINRLVQKDIAIEINTRRLGNKAVLSELIPIYKRYAELGGKYVVLGSDAHTNSSIAYNFGRAKELADYCGLKPIYFKERKPQYNL